MHADSAQQTPCETADKRGNRSAHFANMMFVHSSGEYPATSMLHYIVTWYEHKCSTFFSICWFCSQHWSNHININPFRRAPCWVRSCEFNVISYDTMWNSCNITWTSCDIRISVEYQLNIMFNSWNISLNPPSPYMKSHRPRYCRPKGSTRRARDVRRRTSSAAGWRPRRTLGLRRSPPAGVWWKLGMDMEA